MVEAKEKVYRDSHVARCMVCHSPNSAIFAKLSGQPVHCNRLCSTGSEARNALLGEIELGYCSNCSHVFNLAFQPELMAYDENYENSLHFSPRFQTYARSIAKRLIDRYSLYDKDIIEIGCGQGEFLTLLCEIGDNRGLGFDRSYSPDKNNVDSQSKLTLIREDYSEYKFYAGRRGRS